MDQFQSFFCVCEFFHIATRIIVIISFYLCELSRHSIKCHVKVLRIKLAFLDAVASQ